MSKVVKFLVLTDSKNYNLEHRFAIKLDDFSPLPNSSPFYYTSKTRVRNHGYFESWLRLVFGMTHPWLFLQSN